jgi:hypothetical protein
MRKLLVAVIIFSLGPISTAAADFPGTLPGLPGAAGTSAIPLPAGGLGDPTKQVNGDKIEFTADQIANLPPEMRAAAQAALDSAMAAQPAKKDSAPAIPSQISGLSKELLSQLTPEQLKLVEEAKKTGKIPNGLSGLLENINDIPPDIYAKLTDDQKAVIEKAKAAGLFNKEVLNDLISKADPKVIASLASGGPITSEMIQKLQNTVVAKKINTVSITCTSGKKTIKVMAKSCPKGYKKK